MSSLSLPTTDYIIIGQGLAGSVLSLKLIWKGHKVFVIDQPSLSSSSRIAPGIFNPVVFKRFTTSWKAVEALQSAEAFYTQAEKFLGGHFFHRKEIVKFFTETQEKELWRKKVKEEGAQFLSEEIYENPFSQGVENKGGYAFVKGGGNVETEKFLKATKEHLQSKSCYREETVDYNAIVCKPGGSVMYKDILAKKIIFCEGYRVMQNPYFQWLPMKPAKGEVITVHIPGLKLKDKIISKGVSILPCGEDVYKVSSTFEWKDLTELVTEKARETLTEKLGKIISLPFTVTGQQAGIRPAVSHRRPLLGFHPEHPQLGVFNGLGTKGVMLAPMCAEEMMKALKGEEIEGELNIRQYF